MHNSKEKGMIDLIKRAQQADQDNFIYVVPNILVKKVKSYMLIREDLVFLIGVVEVLLQNKVEKKDNQIIDLALWHSVIITYGKCFTENQAGMSKLEKSIFDNQHKEYLEVHENLMDLRHSYVAHRDDTYREQALVFMKIPKNKEITDTVEYQISSRKLISPNYEDLLVYHKLFLLLMKEVEAKIQKQTQKSHSAFLDAIPPEHVNILLINNIK